MRRVGLIALAVLTVVVWIPLVVNLALESPFVRSWLGRLISSQLRARVEFGPVRWYGNFIQVLWADLEFPSVRNVTRWHVEDLRTRLNWKRMKTGGWPMGQASIGLLEVHSRRKSDATLVQPGRAVGTARSTAPPGGGQASGPSANTRSLPPREYINQKVLPALGQRRLPKLCIAQLTISWDSSTRQVQGFTMNGCTIHSSDNRHWKTAAESGAFWIHGRSYAFRHYAAAIDLPRMAMTAATLQPISGGQLRFRLKLDQGYRLYIDSSWTDIHLAEEIGLTWLRETHFNGAVKLDIDLKRSFDRHLSADLQAHDVVLAITPYLVPLSTILTRSTPGTYRIALLTLQGRATGNLYLIDQFGLDDGTNLQVQGQGVIRDGELNARLKLGLRPEIENWIPGADQLVFVEKRDGFAWAEVQLTGPLRRPREDLSGRLLAAAKAEVEDRLKSQVDELTAALKELLKK